MGLLNDIYRAFIKKESVNVEDVFIFTGGDARNPFKNQEKYHVSVLDIQDDYVKYAFGLSRTLTDSCKISVFRSMYKKKT